MTCPKEGRARGQVRRKGSRALGTRWAIRPGAGQSSLSDYPSLAYHHQVNFILFIRIIRILVQKLQTPNVGKSDKSPYS